ncbi:hypothetical protein NL321_30055, partial [Klebsiella pneumoniae]|nr:hypothetical protein [Klebsiella pneumoniae]
DHLLRGTVIHRAMELFMKAGLPPDAPGTADRLLGTAREVLDTDCAWPVSRRLWLAQLARAVPSLLEEEVERQARATPT